MSIRSFRNIALGLGAAALAMAGLAATPASAHHSFAMYDMSKELTLSGKMIRILPGANHAQIMFELLGEDGEVVIGENGKPVIWGVETGPAAAIARQGVNTKEFPEGTVIRVTLSPLKDGRNFGVLARNAEPIVNCGMDVPEGGCTPETGKVYLKRAVQ